MKKFYIALLVLFLIGLGNHKKEPPPPLPDDPPKVAPETVKAEPEPIKFSSVKIPVFKPVETLPDYAACQTLEKVKLTDYLACRSADIAKAQAVRETLQSRVAYLSDNAAKLQAETAAFDEKTKALRFYKDIFAAYESEIARLNSLSFPLSVVVKKGLLDRRPFSLFAPLASFPPVENLDDYADCENPPTASEKYGCVSNVLLHFEKVRDSLQSRAAFLSDDAEKTEADNAAFDQKIKNCNLDSGCLASTYQAEIARLNGLSFPVATLEKKGVFGYPKEITTPALFASLSAIGSGLNWWLVLAPVGLVGLFLYKATSPRLRYQYQSTNEHSEPEQNPDSWWEVLGVSEHATFEDVKAAYKRLSMIYHPDKYTKHGEQMRQTALETMKKINTAFDEAKRLKGWA